MGFDWKPAAMPGQAPKPAETVERMNYEVWR
jgi:hypothetical protein